MKRQVPRWDEVRRVRESTEHRALVAAGYRAQLALLPHSVEELRAAGAIAVARDPGALLAIALDGVEAL